VDGDSGEGHETERHGRTGTDVVDVILRTMKGEKREGYEAADSGKMAFFVAAMREGGAGSAWTRKNTEAKDKKKKEDRTKRFNRNTLWANEVNEGNSLPLPIRRKGVNLNK